MTAQLTLSAPLSRRTPVIVTEPGSAQRMPGGRRLRAAGRSLWRMLVHAISGPGLDDGAMPAAFEAPYRRGSRYVRSLWHMPF